MNTELQLATDVRWYFLEKAKRRGKLERTRAVILDGVVQSLTENGLEGTTVKEISANAGVSHGTFYNHFDNRNGAILAAAAAVKAEILHAIECSIPRPKKIDEAVILATHTFMRAAQNRPAWAKVLSSTVNITEGSQDPTDNALDQLLRKGHKNGIFRVQITPLLSLQIRTLQTLAISKDAPVANPDITVIATCEALLRLLGRTPKETKIAVKNALPQLSTTD